MSKKKVLLIDDDESIIKLVSRHLKTAGYEVTAAMGGEEGFMDILKVEPDLVLLDIMLPHISGLDLLKKIRSEEKFGGIPIVMLTGQRDAETVQSAIKRGANGFIVKPFPSAGMLLDRVNRWSNQKTEKAWEQLPEAPRLLLQTALPAMDHAFNQAARGKPLPYQDILEIAREIIETIDAGRAGEALKGLKDHDHYTFVHSLRTSIYLVLFARAYEKCNEKNMTDIAMGGLIHDIGQAKIPLNILNKPGDLSPSERDEMKKHVGYGMEIISKIPEIPISAMVITQRHHERIDGKGYPGGLHGPDIEILGRMAAITDTYVSLTDRRVYKPGYSTKEAHGFMAGWTGHLDQELLKEFMEKVVWSDREKQSG